MIQVNNLSFSYNGRPLLQDLNFTINKGEILTILGPNGCGKSTLLKLLRGQLLAQQGTIHWEGKQLSAIPATEKARRIAMVTQFNRVDFPFRVRELVAMGRFPHRRLLQLDNPEHHPAVQQALAMTDLLPLAERTVTNLSGGELQRVILARALAQQTPTLFLDEATSHLDINHRLELSELLLRLNHEEGTTIVQVSHDFDLAGAMSQRILLLNKQGQIAALGTPAEVLTGKTLSSVFKAELRVERNRLTGTPQVIPFFNTTGGQLEGQTVHLVCGGGSGSELMRRLHLAGARVSCGPLNRGDSDEVVASALHLETASEEPFAPLSINSLKEASVLIERSNLLIIATHWWGHGNLGSLELAQQALKKGKQVRLLNPRQEDDFVNGKAWAIIEQLLANGAQQCSDEETLLQQIIQQSRN
jgi:iron complex transport system ATP-binding protein